jgi:ketosteroid isomerase-like protein
VTSFAAMSNEYHRALQSFIVGDAGPVLSVWSTRDDATLANPFGPPVRGFDAIRQAANGAASQVADGTGFTVEQIASYHTADLGYELEIHRFTARLGAGAAEPGPVTLRVTTVYRREDGVGWRVVHRHADPIGRDMTS